MPVRYLTNKRGQQFFSELNRVYKFETLFFQKGKNNLLKRRGVGEEKGKKEKIAVILYKRKMALTERKIMQYAESKLMAEFQRFYVASKVSCNASMLESEKFSSGFKGFLDKRTKIPLN